MGLTRVVIKYDFSLVPEDVKVTKATLQLHFFDNTDWKNSGNILAFRLTTPWSEDGPLPSWTDIWNKPGGDFDSTELDGIGRAIDTGWCDVTLNINVIQEFIDNPETNYGYILIPNRDSGEKEFGGKIHLCEAGYSGAFNGSEVNGIFAPKLKITYDIGTDISMQKKLAKSVSIVNITYHSGSIKFQNTGTTINKICIYSAHGRLLNKFEINTNTSNSFSLPFNTKGLFLVVMISEHGLISKKIIIP